MQASHASLRESCLPGVFRPPRGSSRDSARIQPEESRFRTISRILIAARSPSDPACPFLPFPIVAFVRCWRWGWIEQAHGLTCVEDPRGLGVAIGMERANWVVWGVSPWSSHHGAGTRLLPVHQSAEATDLCLALVRRIVHSSTPRIAFLSAARLLPRLNRSDGVRFR